MKFTLSILLICAVLSCTDVQKNANIIEVHYKGALKNIMKKGDLTAQMSLAQIEDTTNLYALGAIEYLKGEIQIFDGKPYNTFIQSDTITFDMTYSRSATLYVSAIVANWNTYPIPNSIKSKNELERFIEETAKKAQINTSEPFPFLLEGTARSLDWHIINWAEGDREHSHEKHIRSGKYGQLLDHNVQLLGFYSDSHHAIFTHHTTNIHIHMRTTDGTIAGHVDALEVGAGMILKLPLIQ